MAINGHRRRRKQGSISIALVGHMPYRGLIARLRLCGPIVAALFSPSDRLSCCPLHRGLLPLILSFLPPYSSFVSSSSLTLKQSGWDGGVGGKEGEGLINNGDGGGGRIAWAFAHGKNKSDAYFLSLTPALLVLRSRDMTHEGYFTSSSPMILSHAIFVASCPVRLHCWGMIRKRLDQATIVCVTKWMFVQRPSSDSGSSDE